MKNKVKFLIILMSLVVVTTGCYEQETYVSVRTQKSKDKKEAEKTEKEVAEGIKKNNEDNKENTEKTPAKKIATVNVESLNLREQAGADQRLLASIPQNTELEVLEEKDVDGVKWTKVKYNDREGFVLSEYIKIKTGE
ncbi:MAG: SH3 domain-containing protein [Finegoldia magna]|uniref:SH3 domain-containing protein n=1 Tax=Finegoldia magna TaxID=1260 RepID=A0A943LCA3_FINMA|nr:SH3 domain-containing protein [Finegoldia magna]MBS5964995.1 SH3 domain-containing protein [Finegoldia magna]